MKITHKEITVAELVKNYKDDGDNGVFGYDNKLTIRPAYQREFVYNDKQREAVIDTVRKGFPLNVMYWSKTGKDTYEVLDGQQRTISIAQYVNKDFIIKVDGNDKFYHNLTENEKKALDDYKLTIYVCEGTEEEKLGWFKTINIAGEVLTNQELLNATYTGPWLTDAKIYFSKRNCAAVKMSEGYIKGSPIRQDILEKVLRWIADRDGLASGQEYMAKHQNDEDADDLWTYYQDVINWAKTKFPDKIKGITDSQEWGILYNKYKDKKYNTKTLKSDVEKLIADDDVTKAAGIIPYVLSDKTKHDERHLSIRAFTESQKRRAYEKQKHKCVKCGKEFDFKDMEGDHKKPWSKGGRTIDENLQMLCKDCNKDKSDK